MNDLKAKVFEERLASYARLRGGFTVPLAGATYWAALAAAGYFAPEQRWALIAFVGSGVIFPLALLYGRIFGVDILKAGSAVDTVIGPAFIGMLLFWPMAIIGYWSDPQLLPLMMAIGLSIHWPVIGWLYGRTAIYAAHAIVRMLVVSAIWLMWPEHRFTWLPTSVTAVYLITVLVILVDSARVRSRLSPE